MHYDLRQSGKYIHDLRVKKGYTQGKLAEMLNIDRSFLSHIEAGRKGCSVDLLVALSNIFTVSLDELVTGQNCYCLAKETGRSRLKIEIPQHGGDPELSG